MRFGSEVDSELDRLLASWGDEGYLKQWGHPFPHEAHLKLKQALECDRNHRKARCDVSFFPCSLGGVQVVVLEKSGFELCLAKMSSLRNRAQSLTVKTALGSCASPRIRRTFI